MTKREALAHAGLGRMASLPTVWTDVLGAAVLGGGSLVMARLLPVLVATSLIHIGGSALMQAYDRRAPRSSMRSLRQLGLLLIPLGIAVVAVQAITSFTPGDSGLAAIGAAVALGAATVTRSAWHRGDPLIPLVSALARVLVWLLAALATAHALTGPVIAASLAVASYVGGIAVLARQHLRADLTSAWPVALLAIPFMYAMPAREGGFLASVLYMALLAWVVWGIVLLGVRRHGTARRGVERLVAAIALLDALLVARAGQDRIALGMLLCFASSVLVARAARFGAEQRGRARRVARS
jgi:4-hydroxybenzoate polyprenyltransferase